MSSSVVEVDIELRFAEAVVQNFSLALAVRLAMHRVLQDVSGLIGRIIVGDVSPPPVIYLTSLLQVPENSSELSSHMDSL